MIRGSSQATLCPQELERATCLRTSIQAKDGDAQIIAMIDDASSRATLWADRFEHRHIGLSLAGERDLQPV